MPTKSQIVVLFEIPTNYPTNSKLSTKLKLIELFSLNYKPEINDIFHRIYRLLKNMDEIQLVANIRTAFAQDDHLDDQNQEQPSAKSNF